MLHARHGWLHVISMNACAIPFAWPNNNREAADRKTCPPCISWVERLSDLQEAIHWALQLHCSCLENIQRINCSLCYLLRLNLLIRVSPPLSPPLLSGWVGEEIVKVYSCLSGWKDASFEKERLREKRRYWRPWKWFKSPGTVAFLKLSNPTRYFCLKKTLGLSLTRKATVAWTFEKKDLVV